MTAIEATLLAASHNIQSDRFVSSLTLLKIPWLIYFYVMLNFCVATTLNTRIDYET